jgi:hypothetical protein
MAPFGLWSAQRVRNGRTQTGVGLEAIYDQVLSPTVIARLKEGHEMATNDDAPPATPRMNWGDEIRKIREGQGLSQRRLAKLADDRASPLCVESSPTAGNHSFLELWSFVHTNTGHSAGHKRWSST